MTRARSRRATLWLLIAAALFMRALVPQGYMPDRSAGGAIAVTLCSSDGVHLIPLRDGADRDEERQRAEPPCAFAGLGSAALLPPPAPELPLPAPAVFARFAPPAAAEPSAAPRLLPPARGPPLTV